MADFDILCIGEVNVDLILSGIDRVPEFGQEVLAEGLGMHPGGCTANVAMFAAALGLRAALCARIGRDDFGDFLLQKLDDRGVCTEFIIRDDTLRTGTTVALSGEHDRAFATYLGTIDSLRRSDISRQMLERSRHVHIGSYFLQRQLQPDIGDIFRTAQGLGLTTSLDTGYDPYEEWGGGITDTLGAVDFFMPNEIEAVAIAGTDDPAAAAEKLSEIASCVTLKLGQDGSRLYDGTDCWSANAFPVEVVDTTCCGDAFNAGLLYAMLADLSELQMLRWGNAAGSIVAGSPGSGCRQLTEQAIEEMVSD